MKFQTVIHQQCLSPDQIRLLAEAGNLEKRCHYHLLRHSEPIPLDDWRQSLGCDINTLPSHFDPGRVKLFVTDLDSTLVAIETIDEIADLLGLRTQVAAITEKAMAGELDFKAALEERVALLEGLPEEKLEQVYRLRMKLNPGARDTLAWLKRQGIITALVSGGFTYFTDKLKQALPLDATLACQLEIKQGRLTGNLTGKIVDKYAKAEFVTDLAKKHGIEFEQIVAMGDGANDLSMLERAGLGVAYHGHEIVKQCADARIDHGDWRDVRWLLLGTDDDQ